MAVEFLSEVGAESRRPDATNRKCHLNGAEGTALLCISSTTQIQDLLSHLSAAPMNLEIHGC